MADRQQITILTNKNTYEGYKQQLNEDSVDAVVKVHTLSRKALVEATLDESINLVIVCLHCIEDLRNYEQAAKQVDSSKVVLLVHPKARMTALLAEHSRNKVLRVADMSMADALQGLIATFARISIIELVGKDLLDICAGGGPLWCKYLSGSEEYILSGKWIPSRRICMLVNVIGDISLQDASDICKRLVERHENRDLLFGARYDQTEELKVFSLWRKD